MAIVSCKDLSLKSFGLLYTAGKGKHFCELGGLLSDGNTKLPSTTAIFNLSSAHDCPSRKLGLCKAEKQGAKCYAIKSECSMRPAVLPYRRKQEAFWFKTEPVDFVSQFILINALKKLPYKNIRFNESGDFHAQNDVYKMERIAQMLRRFGIRCYCYTSRNDLDFSKCKHLIVSGSNFKKRGISNIFKIIKDVKKREKGWGVCKGDCKICTRCVMKNLKTVVKKH